MEKKCIIDEELRGILHQLGFGTLIGIAFIGLVCFGGWFAHIVSGM
jgi:hypothetical protein